MEIVKVFRVFVLWFRYINKFSDHKIINYLNICPAL